jgi:hypothetical protein
MPPGLEERRFYTPTDRGFEAELGGGWRPAQELQGSTLSRKRNFLRRRVSRAAFQARARESRHTGRRPGLGVSGRE